MKRNKILAALMLAIALVSSTTAALAQRTTRWNEEQANTWWENSGWVSGCNYIPCNAINQIEMWHSSTFSPELIDKELGWAEELGFNVMRVYLSSLVWQDEPKNFKKNIKKYLQIANKHNIKTVFVIFDDCWNAESSLGLQPAPEPGVHNSGWAQDPCKAFRDDTKISYPILEAYVNDLLTTFAKDKRILCWDLHNEPSNSGHGDSSLPLLKKVFDWARKVNPTQPLTSGVWTGRTATYEFQIANSDIITYHNYSDVNTHKTMIDELKKENRPLICTEYMARTNNSKFQTVLPMLRKENVGAINWGFVAGKTNTIFAWNTPLPDQKEPEVWFHDIYRPDKTPFDANEIKVIKEVNFGK